MDGINPVSKAAVAATRPEDESNRDTDVKTQQESAEGKVRQAESAEASSPSSGRARANDDLARALSQDLANSNSESRADNEQRDTSEAASKALGSDV